MVSLNKKSKSDKNRDFVRQKVKVGRLKPGAANATDTKVVSQRLNLGEQHLCTAHKVEEVARGRNVSPTDLSALLQPHLSQVGHYQTNARRRAISTILRQCSQRPKEALSMVGTLLNGVVGRTMVDEDQMVRAEGRQLLSLLVVNTSPEGSSTMIPFMEGWMAMVGVAATHINPEVRQDARSVVKVFLKTSPFLLRPFIGRLLCLFSNNSNLVSTKAIKSKKTAGTTRDELMWSLLDFFIKWSGSKPATANVVVYQWNSVQNTNLSDVRLRTLVSHFHDGSSISSALSRQEITATVTWYGESLLRNYLEALPFLKRGDEGDETVTELQRLCHHFLSFISAVEIKVEDVRDALPKAIQSLDFDALDLNKG